MENITTRFRTEFDYQLKIMPDTAQREVILEIIHKHKEYLAFSGICACRRCADSITSDTMYAVNGSPKECAFEAKEKSTNISPVSQ